MENNAKLSEKSLKLHKQTAITIDKIKDEAFALIFNAVKKHGHIFELEVQQYILKRFGECGLITDGVPIVARGKNSVEPHYYPSLEKNDKIQKGDIVKIDLWAKLPKEDAVWSDITWMGYVGAKPSAFMLSIFNIVKTAIQKTIEFLNEQLPKREVLAYEVDNFCRAYIEQAGYLEYFVHRTGHSLSTGDKVHGFGPNFNSRTMDSRPILDGQAFTIEPGIYLPEQFGVRIEINVIIKNRQVVLTSKFQKRIITTTTC